MVVIDFNSSLYFGQKSLKGLADAYRTNCFLTTAGLSAQAPIRLLCPPLSRQSPCTDVFMFRPVPMHDVCADNVSTEPARHRNMSAGNTGQTLSLRHSRQGLSQHTCQSQRTARLAKTFPAAYLIIEYHLVFVFWHTGTNPEKEFFSHSCCRSISFANIYLST